MGAERRAGKARKRSWSRCATLVPLIALLTEACASRASTVAPPWKPDDPATCVDWKESPEEALSRERTDALREPANRELATLAHCTKALPASEDAVAEWTLEVEPDGSIAGVRIVGSTLTDCRPLECVRTALVGRRLSVAPSKEPSKLGQLVRLRRGSVSDADVAEVLQRLARPDVPKTCAEPGATISGRLPPAEIQRIIRSKYDVFRKCYESALARNPNAEGLLSVRFVINAEGRVTLPRIAENTIPDCDAVRCVRDNFLPLVFPKPQGGIVTVVYPIMFSPG